MWKGVGIGVVLMVAFLLMSSVAGAGDQPQCRTAEDSVAAYQNSTDDEHVERLGRLDKAQSEALMVWAGAPAHLLPVTAAIDVWRIGEPGDPGETISLMLLTRTGCFIGANNRPANERLAVKTLAIIQENKPL
jgi:hypothetical protein